MGYPFRIYKNERSKCYLFYWLDIFKDNQDYDVETNLFLVTSRYYSPELWRFIQPADVSSLNPQSINGLNLYTYALNNSISIIYNTFSVGRSASSGIESFPIGKHSNSTTGSSNSNSSGPTFKS
jgi:RHS repeat-associated protein